MDLDLRLVRYFVAVADELHFGRAAAKLYVSQPALSKQIRRLEEQVGVQLLVRDTRHVTLTARGQQFLTEARRLLAIAQTMQQPARANTVRMAHVFELDTSRVIADSYAARFPGVALSEHAMDSAAQLEALLQHRLDVAILRISPRMVVDHPSGWEHRLLRLEPLVLVGRPTGGAPADDGPAVSRARGPARPAAATSLHDGPLDVFGDPPESGSYNAHGDYLSAAERGLGIELRWLGTPGAFSHCLARVIRSDGRALFLEFFSYARRYAAHGFSLSWPLEAQPYYPWSLAWRSEPSTPALSEFLEVARAESTGRGWLEPATAAAGPPWMPPDDPVRRDVPFVSG
jgi:DNA-binding transcriptional LysR family regulator